MDVSLTPGKYCVDAVSLLLRSFLWCRPQFHVGAVKPRTCWLVFVTQRHRRLRMTQFQEIEQVQTSELHVSLFDIWQRVI